MRMLEILREHRVPIAPASHEHNRLGWLNFDCPYCSPGWRHYRMGYNERGHYCNCWSCGRKPVAEVLSMILGVSYRDIAELTRDIDKPRRTTKPKRTRLVLPHGIGPLMDQHKEYLKRRGFDWRELIKLWEIRGIGISSSMSWRIFIPIIYEGSIVSWTTRSISDEIRERYISASSRQESMDHKHLVYGVDYVRHTIVIFLGPTDVWSIGPGTCCTFGTAYSREQIARMARYPIRVVCLDSTREAQKKAQELCEALSVFPGETYNVVLSGKDPAECKEEAREIRRRFLSYNSIKELTTALPLNDNNG